jgi:hypothetical protein
LHVREQLRRPPSQCACVSICCHNSGHHGLRVSGSGKAKICQTSSL